MTEQKTKLTPVQSISTTGKSVLVEWKDKKGLHRASIPTDKLAEKIDQELLDAAPPFGVPWADAPIKAFTGDDLQAALYAAGVWTSDDVQGQPQKAIGALQYLYYVHLGSLVEFAAKYKLSEVK
jgi:hypothetical protein